jgi:hypothetical protein
MSFEIRLIYKCSLITNEENCKIATQKEKCR